MKIVIVDGGTLNPGDLSWEGLAELGDIEVHDATPPEKLIERVGDAGAAIITNKVPIVAETMDALPNLRYIGVTATGYNVVDVEAARQREIIVTNVPSYGTAAVAQATFALLLELTNHVGAADADVRRRWPGSGQWCYWDEPIVELAGRTFGVVGLGRIGTAVARIAGAMEMGVIAHDPGMEESDVAEVAPLEELFERSDVVSLHCPQTPETERMVNAERLALMKPTAYLLNLSRGGLVEEPDLAEALNDERIAGAGLDVLSAEPPSPDNPLLLAKNCVITPHVAWASRASRARLLAATVENLRAFLEGRPQNVVS